MKSGNPHQQLAMNSLSNLRGFASKMREQAREAAKKMPSLDEMAAKDDYIHKEEFNVKGEKQEKEETRKSQNTEDNSSSAPPSWSLIDKLQNEAAETRSTQSISQSDEASFKSNLTDDEDVPLVRVNATPGAATRKISRPLMLSVVTDAMTAKPAVPEKPAADESSVASNSSSDSDSWNEEGDEEDPILSMIRKSKGDGDETQKKPEKSKSKKKQSSQKEKPKMHRFLTDMEDAENQLETNSQPNGKQSPIPLVPLSLPETPRELGSWMKTIASNQMNKILKRPDQSSSQPIATTSAPPLASRWRSPKPAANPLQEEYHSQDSTDLLGDDELQQLARLKQSNSAGKFSAAMNAMYEHRHFAFILFTLVLAGVVYFFQFGELEDGVTR